MTIEKPTAQEQAQARQMRAMMEALRTAGYGLGSPGELQAGMLAYNAAVVIQERAPADLLRRTPAPAKVGRNDPCPCGSGKKYKKCCADKAPSEQPAPGAGPRVDPRLIPRLANDQSAERDLRQLAVQLVRDPVLATVRFPAADVEAAVARHRSAHPELDDAQLEATLDGLAHDYAREQPATAEVIARLSDELLDAASRASSTDELRALALGLALAILHGSHNPESPVPSNPLVDLLFRITWIEARRARRADAADAAGA